MPYFKVLHSLVDQQQFKSLQNNVQHYLDESGDIQALPLKALAAAHLGQHAEVVSVLSEIEAQLHLFESDAQVDLAAVYCLMHRVDEACSLLEPVLDDSPDNAIALARLAWCRVQQRQLEKARELYQKSIDLMPERLLVWSALARVHLKIGNSAQAQNTLDSGIARLQTLHINFTESVVAQFTAQFRSLQLEIWVAAQQMAQVEYWLEEKFQSLEEDEWVALILIYVNLLAAHNQHNEAEGVLREALKKYSDNLALISQFAELAQVQGRTMQSIQLIKRLIHLAKVQGELEVPYWVRLSNACLHQQTAQARQAAEKALSLVGEMQASDKVPGQVLNVFQLQAKNALARVESQEQNYGLAEVLFTEILADNPFFLPALQGLGQQKMQCGNIEAAIVLFERVKQIDPEKGYSSLINVGQFPSDEISLKRMEAVARQPSLEGGVRSAILLQIASARENNKQYEQAFVLALEANNAQKALLTYDATAHRLQCARIRYAFCKTLYEHRKDCGIESSLPVYVLGMPRSGTTLVEQILAGHSEICGAGELGVIPSRIQGLNRWERHTGSGRKYPECMDDLTPTVVKGIAKGIIEELQAFDEKAKYVVDKLPHNFENIGLIKFLFPNAKIISVRRDPRDIAISNYFTDYQAKHGGMGFAYDLEWMGEQLADHNLLMQHWHDLFPGEILEINYEDVVEDTEGMARKMLDYVGVEWQPQVLAFNELERSVKTASVWQVRQPIYKTSKEKWRYYQKFLAPLIKGTNKKIKWEAIKMVSLPKPGMLTNSVSLYRDEKLDEAEYEFKKLLHYIPQHAAANFMLGVIYARKNHVTDAIEYMEVGHKICPWNIKWCEDLCQAYDMVGATDKAELLRVKMKDSFKNQPSRRGGILANTHEAKRTVDIFSTMAE